MGGYNYGGDTVRRKVSRDDDLKVAICRNCSRGIVYREGFEFTLNDPPWWKFWEDKETKTYDSVWYHADDYKVTCNVNHRFDGTVTKGEIVCCSRCGETVVKPKDDSPGLYEIQRTKDPTSAYECPLKAEPVEDTIRVNPCSEEE